MGKQNKSLAEDKRQYNLPVSDAQYAYIETQAKKRNMETTDYIRDLLYKADPNFPKFVDKKPFEQKSVYAIGDNHYAIMTESLNGVRVTIHKRNDDDPQKSINYPISDILYNNPTANNYLLAIQYMIGTANSLS